MKIEDIYEKVKAGEKLTITGKGIIKSITPLANGQYEIKYERAPHAKFYGRLTSC